MKKYGLIVFPAILLLALFMITANAQAMEEGGTMKDRIHVSGLIEFGGVWQSVGYTDGGDDDASDFALTTVELAVGAEVSDWVSVETLLLYEDPTSFEGENDETSVDLDEAIVTIRNADVCPGLVSVGRMYVPFGALLTHFPDDPLIDQPLTLLMGETGEKALLVGYEREGLSLSAYAFNGDVDEVGQENHVETFGLDANYTVENEEGPNVLVGASYISNIAESDGLQEALEEHEAEIEDYVGGFAAYLSVAYDKFFADVEYMTALDEFDAHVLDADSMAAEPSVWNVEVGYNCDFREKNLEIALKYAGSDEAEALGYPEKRYGICLNREILEGVMASAAYIHDDYEDGDVRDDRDVLLGQIAIEF